MEYENYLRFALALVLVIGLIGLAAWAGRRFGIGGQARSRGRARRLTVVEATGLDAKHRLVLVRRDATEHLLLLGPAGDVVVESGIAADDEPAAEPAATAAGPAEAAR